MKFSTIFAGVAFLTTAALASPIENVADRALNPLENLVERASCYNFADPDSGCNDNVCMCPNGSCHKHGPNGGCGNPGKKVTKGHGTCLPSCV